METALVIGVGPGIGIATAERFAKEGFRIVLASRSGGGVASNVAALRRAGVAVELETVDAADRRPWRPSCDATPPTWRCCTTTPACCTPTGELEPRAPSRRRWRACLSSDMQVNLVRALAGEGDRGGDGPA